MKDQKHTSHPALSPSIAIVDNDTRSLESLRQLLSDRLPSARIAWMTTSGKEALTMIGEHTPSLLLLDMSLEDIQGPSICRRIRRESSAFPVLAMTSFSLKLYAAKAKTAGAQGLVSKNVDEDLVQTVISVLRDGSMHGFESQQIAHIRIANEQTSIPQLTLREEEIINLCADEGLLDAEIADKLDISEATVRKHMQHVLQKLGARTSRQAVAIWLSPRSY
ncbi:response regulator [Bifidobacterium callitrichos]|nr:response regulator transcription factor [Bifidobacterium callitrichos]